MKVVCLIPARGGSKGIPNKNIVEIKGKPLLSYSINNCHGTSCSEVWVSTDSDNIARVAREYKALVLSRPKEISGDTSSSESTLLHFAENIDFDILVFVQNTSPLATHRDIQKGIDLVISGDCDSAFSVTEEHWVPRWTKEVSPINWNPAERPRRQDMESLYVENGAFYVTKREHLLKSKNRYSGKIKTVNIPLARSFQIDSYEDLELINALI